MDEIESPLVGSRPTGLAESQKSETDIAGLTHFYNYSSRIFLYTWVSKRPRGLPAASFFRIDSLCEESL
jgi:hypothetical protein